MNLAYKMDFDYTVLTVVEPSRNKSQPHSHKAQHKIAIRNFYANIAINLHKHCKQYSASS